MVLYDNEMKNKLSIINAYRLYEDNSNTDLSKTIIQQWNILEERDTEEINIDIMTNDLSIFINLL